MHSTAPMPTFWNAEEVEAFIRRWHTANERRVPADIIREEFPQGTTDYVLDALVAVRAVTESPEGFAPC